MKDCKLCGSTSKIIFHHLSYEPEFGIDVCRKCHFALHSVSLEALPKIIELKKQYGHLWVDGNAQYQKSKHYRKIQLKYRKTSKCKAKEKEKRKTPEWQEKRRLYLVKKGDEIKKRKHDWHMKNREKNLDKMRQRYYKLKEIAKQDSALDAS